MQAEDVREIVQEVMTEILPNPDGMLLSPAGGEPAMHVGLGECDLFLHGAHWMMGKLKPWLCVF